MRFEVYLTADRVKHHCAMRLLQIEHDVAHDLLKHVAQQARRWRHTPCGRMRRREAGAYALEGAVPLYKLHIYTYIHIYTHTYTYIHINTHIYT